ncbi:odorant receptor 59b-like [Drosophila busckii]|uniref:odorant receptor 59b-like n=1 Tax=Drosophila busckii TaxID=30019 RepID=UPI001432AF1E|nr:odorant receptor 59b-like [Drosophila busckii]
MKFQYVRKSNEGTLMKSRDAYRYLSYGMSTVGWLSPPNRWGCQWPYRLWSSIVMVMAFYLPCGMFISYAREFHNFKPEELFTSLQAAINAPGAFCRGMLSFLGMWRLHKLMDTLDKMDKRCISQAEQIKVHEIVGRCNMIFLFYVTCYFLYATCTFAAALSRGQTPYGLYNPLVDSQKHLYMSGFIEYMLLSAGLYYNLMTDVFTLIFGFTVRLHLSLLSDRIQQLHIPDSKTEAEYNDALVDCIKDYKHIINICNLMRPYISANVFVQYLISGMVFGITLINVLFFGDLWSKVPSAFYMTALL